MVTPPLATLAYKRPILPFGNAPTSVVLDATLMLMSSPYHETIVAIVAGLGVTPIAPLPAPIYPT